MYKICEYKNILIFFAKGMYYRITEFTVEVRGIFQ